MRKMLLIPRYINNKPTAATAIHEAAQHEALKIFYRMDLNDEEKIAMFDAEMDIADNIYRQNELGKIKEYLPSRKTV